MIVNCMLKASPERSHTGALAERPIPPPPE